MLAIATVIEMRITTIKSLVVNFSFSILTVIATQDARMIKITQMR